MTVGFLPACIPWRVWRRACRAVRCAAQVAGADAMGGAAEAGHGGGAAAQPRGADGVQDADTEAVYEEVDLEDLEYDEVEEVTSVLRPPPRTHARHAHAHVHTCVDEHTGFKRASLQHRSIRTRVLAETNSESRTHNWSRASA